ncbi:MAG: response regulator transcription factor [Deltaproteobacteria bacterium]|nr:response regulator transcription factor [Deltaproteobacteria bacterium]
MPDRITVFVVEDDPRQMKAVWKLVEGHEATRIAGGAGSVEQALREVPQLAPEVVLMDLELPGADGIEGTRALKKLEPSPDVLVLTSFDDEDHVFQAMRAGASGYVVKGASGKKLIDAVVEVHAGGTVIEPRLAKRFWDYFKGVQEPAKAGPELSGLEKEILFAIAKGLSNAEVGRIVSLDRRTVRTHLGHIYAKLGVRSHVEAVAGARKLGLLHL